MLLNSLFSLLDDSDENIYSNVRNKIISLSESDNNIVNLIEKEVYRTSNPLKKERLIELLEFFLESDFNTFNEITKWSKKDNPRLDVGLFFINKYINSNTNEEFVKKKITKITKDVWIELNETQTALEKVQIINKIIFDIYKFRVTNENILSEDDFLIEKLIKNKTASNVLFASFYLSICERLDIPVFGINYPNYFILGYFEKNEALFYIDISQKGELIATQEFRKHIKNNESYSLLPCSNITIINLLIKYLSDLYFQIGEIKKKNKLNKISLFISNTKNF